MLIVQGDKNCKLRGKVNIRDGEFSEFAMFAVMTS